MDIGIDRIFEMLSWDNDEKIQAQGINEAKKIKNISVLIQPIESKSVWENCAKVLASKKDEELKIYLIDLFKWLQDMNWPGADIIYNRLKHMPIKQIEMAYRFCLSLAKQTEDMVWERVLVDFYNNF